MSGPKKITRTWEETVQVCPCCENEFTDVRINLRDGRHFDVGVDDGFTAITDRTEHMPVICVELDEISGRDAAWVYYHTLSELDDDLKAATRGPKQIIRDLQEQHDDKPGAPKERVIEHFHAVGLLDAQTERRLQKLRDKGEIYSPDRDHLRVV